MIQSLFQSEPLGLKAHEAYTYKTLLRTVYTFNNNFTITIYHANIIYFGEGFFNLIHTL
jgi:hypothetical protein